MGKAGEHNQGMRTANLKHEFARFTSGKVLLVGNGPSITDNPFGAIIDAFDGPVVRFNRFQLKPVECTGTRVDLWVVRYSFTTNGIDKWPDHDRARAHLLTRFPKDLRFDDKGRKHSTGVATMLWCLREGFTVTLHGFDHFRADRPVHYYPYHLVETHPQDKETVEHAIKHGSQITYFGA